MSTKPTAHLLVVDGDTAFRERLIQQLARAGFSVAGAPDGRSLDTQLAQRKPDLVLLDPALPGEEGFSIARRLIGEWRIPIIMLSARAEEEDRIRGLEAGADDYIKKTCNQKELIARIRAVLRCRRCDDEGDRGVLTFGPYRFEVEPGNLTRGNAPISLTTRERELLRVFTQNPNRILDRDTLTDRLRGYERSPFDRSIDVQIARLRAKIEPDSRHPKYIRTVWGKGYLFNPRGEA